MNKKDILNKWKDILFTQPEWGEWYVGFLGDAEEPRLELLDRYHPDVTHWIPIPPRPDTECFQEYKLD